MLERYVLTHYLCNFPIQQTYGQSCNTADSFGCNAALSPFTCATATGAPGTGRCVFASAHVGDPCIDNADCINTGLTCSSTLGVCMPVTAAGGPCSAPGQCVPDHYCNATAGINGGVGACIPRLGIGSACTWDGDDWSKERGGCVRGAVCYRPTGTCATAFSLPNGANFSYTPGNFFNAGYGTNLCASGLAVPVPNATTGYTGTGVGRCVASLNLTAVGQPCGTSCNWSSAWFSELPVPVGGDGSLVCAPVGLPGLPCALVQSTYLSVGFLGVNVAYQSCIIASTGPSGVACSHQTSPGSCSLDRRFRPSL